MKTLSKNRVIDAIGVAAVTAGLVLLAAVVASADPIGLSVGALIGGGFAFGALGCGLKEAAARRARRYATSAASYASRSAAIVTIRRVADATASEFDDREVPSFAPVTSLTEAQVERQRAEQRRQERRAELTRV